MTLLAKDANGKVVQAIKPGTIQTVTVGVASAAVTNVFGDTSTIVRVVSSTDCHYRTGSGTPVAVITDSFLPANVVEFVGVVPGERIAFIQNAAGGTAYVTEGAD